MATSASCSGLSNGISPTNTPAYSLRSVKLPTHPTSALLLRDGTLITASPDNGIIRWLDFNSLKSPNTLPEVRNRITLFNTGGVNPYFIASNSILLASAANGEVCLWDVETRTLFSYFPTCSPIDFIPMITFSNSRFLFISTATGSTLFYNISNSNSYSYILFAQVLWPIFRGREHDEKAITTANYILSLIREYFGPCNPTQEESVPSRTIEKRYQRETVEQLTYQHQRLFALKHSGAVVVWRREEKKNQWAETSLLKPLKENPATTSRPFDIHVDKMGRVITIERECYDGTTTIWNYPLHSYRQAIMPNFALRLKSSLIHASCLIGSSLYLATEQDTILVYNLSKMNPTQTKPTTHFSDLGSPLRSFSLFDQCQLAPTLLQNGIDLKILGALTLLNKNGSLIAVSIDGLVTEITERKSQT